MEGHQFKSRQRLGWTLGLLLVGAIGFAAGAVWQASSTVHADVTELPRRDAFLAGGERSELVLREISGTLKKMDGRLERIEKVVAEKGAAQLSDKKKAKP